MHFAPALALVAVLPASALASNAELNAKPGGKIKVVHGTPSWREEFTAQMKPGLNWRLGSNAATTCTTQAGMVFEDGVLFPGEYHLALLCERTDAYVLVFHHDGPFYAGEANEASVALSIDQVGEKDATRMLEIELDRDSDKQGYVVQINFGPHRLMAPFTTAKSKTLKAKAGRHSFTAVYLERTDLEALKERVSTNEVQVCRVERKQGGPLRMFLRGGETPQLRVAGLEKSDAGRTIDGKDEQADKALPEFALALAPGKESVTFTFTIDATNSVFEVPADVFEADEEADSGRRDG